LPADGPDQRYDPRDAVIDAIFAAAPRVIQETLIFPYLSGAEFYSELQRAKARLGHLQGHAVSTEQIISSIGIFGTRDNPTKVTLGPLTKRERGLRERPRRIRDEMFLFQHLNDQNDAIRGASGWDGDRYAVVNTPQGPGIVWLTSGIHPLKAGEFYDLAGRAIEKRFSTKAGAGSSIWSRNTRPGRAVSTHDHEISGRPVVIYQDLPSAHSPKHPQSRDVKLASSA